MENEENKPGAVVGKKEVWFLEAEEPPKPPPRKNRKRRLSKSRRGVHFGNLPPEDDSSPAESPEEQDQEEVEEDGKDIKEPGPSRSSQESLSDVEMPKSRLPELLRRDTFCDALDFRLYSLKRIPGRRSSSLDALYWNLEEDDEHSGEHSDDQGMTRSAEHLPQSRADWLKGLLDEPQPPTPPTPPTPPPQEAKNEENNNLNAKKPVLILDPAELTSTLEKIKSTHITTKQHYHCVYASQQQTKTTTLTAAGNDRDSPSRKSSMTESLQEFESSLMEMLKAQPHTDTEEEHPPNQQPPPPPKDTVIATATH